ncbi:unnamed protein product [Sphagnum balticum]
MSSDPTISDYRISSDPTISDYRISSDPIAGIRQNPTISDVGFCRIMKDSDGRNPIGSDRRKLSDSFGSDRIR